MSRPENITLEDLARWDELIKTDPLIHKLPIELINSPLFRETCYAGIWLSEKLEELQVPLDISLRLAYHGGKLSFGRDAWEVHQQLLQDYLDNKLIFEPESDGILN